jgi:hypothetical protein
MSKRARTEAAEAAVPAGTAFRVWLGDEEVHLMPNEQLTPGQRAAATRVELAGADAIPEGFFANCPELESFAAEAGSRLTSMGPIAFEGCRKLCAVSLAEGLQKISMRAFYGCPSLCEVDFPESLLHIDSLAFDDSPLVTGILPAGLRSVAPNAFDRGVDLDEMYPHVTLIPNPPFGHYRMIFVASSSSYFPNPVHTALLLKMKANRLGATKVNSVTCHMGGKDNICMSGTVSPDGVSEN